MRTRHEPKRMPSGTRAGATARARAYVESGAFEADLARRVAFKTESQLLPASLPELRRYLEEEMAPAFARLGFTARIYDNPLPGQGPCCLPRASRMQSCRPCWATAMATSSAAWRTSGPRARARGSRPATAIASTAAARPTTRASTPSTWRRSRRAGGARRTARLQRQVHHRDGRGGGLEGAGRAGRRPQGRLRGRRAGRLGRPAREARASHHDAGLPRRHQFRSRLRLARGRPSLRQLGRPDRQPGHHPGACAGLHRRSQGRAAGPRPPGAAHDARPPRIASPTSRSTAARRGRRWTPGGASLA